MSTANKLSYLNDTKSLLRTSLNKFGSSILSTDTFRSYDTKLNDIYNKLPKVTATGQGLTISNVQNGLLDDFKINGVDLEQDTTTGKNLFDKDNANIITAYIGDSYNWTFSGSAICYRINCKPNTSYTISCTNSNETIFRGSVTDSEDIPTSGNNLSIYSTVRRTNNSPITVNTGANAKYVLVQLSNTQYLTSLETLQVEEGSSVTSYEPYTGGIPSPNPDYPQEIKVVEGRQVITDKGKNLLKPHAMEDTKNGITVTYDEETRVYTFNGTCTEDNTTFVLSEKSINFIAGLTKSITYWVDGSCSGFCSIRHFDSSYASSCTYSILNISSANNKIEQTSNASFVSPTQRTSIRFDNGSVANNFKIKVMVTDDENTDYEPYYEPISYNIDLQLENIYLAKMPNTDYKNRIYRNNGNWYYEENVKKIVLDGSENWGYGSISGVFYTTSITNYAISSNVPYSNYYTGVSNVSGASNMGQQSNNTIGFINVSGQTTPRFYIKDTKYTNNTPDLKTWLSTHNLEVWYILENSTTTQITNTTLINQLEAISVHTGTNIITISNDNNIIPEIEITRLKELEKLA